MLARSISAQDNRWPGMAAHAKVSLQPVVRKVLAAFWNASPCVVTYPSSALFVISAPPSTRAKDPQRSRGDDRVRQCSEISTMITSLMVHLRSVERPEAGWLSLLGIWQLPSLVEARRGIRAL